MVRTLPRSKLLSACALTFAGRLEFSIACIAWFRAFTNLSDPAWQGRLHENFDLTLISLKSGNYDLTPIFPAGAEAHGGHRRCKDVGKRLVDPALLEVVGIGAEAALGVEPDELLVDQLGDATRVKLGVGALHARGRPAQVFGFAGVAHLYGGQGFGVGAFFEVELATPHDGPTRQNPVGWSRRSGSFASRSCSHLNFSGSGPCRWAKSPGSNFQLGLLLSSQCPSLPEQYVQPGWPETGTPWPHPISIVDFLHCSYISLKQRLCRAH